MQTQRADPVQEYIEDQLTSLRRQWPTLVQTANPAPQLSWDQWCEVFLDMTDSRAEELLVRGALAGVIKTAQFLPADQTATSLLRIAIGLSTTMATPIDEESLMP